MKKLVLLSFLCLTTIIPLKGQNDSAPVSPQPLKYDKEYIARTCSTCLVEKFYPIGWSKDGRFAYLLEPPDEGCGCYLAEVYIIDLAKNKVVWHYFYAGDKGFMESALGTKINRHLVYKNKEQLWKGEYNTIQNKLNENGIIQQNEFNTASFPLITGQDTLKLSLKKIYISASKSKYGYKYIDSIHITSNKELPFVGISTDQFMILPPDKVNLAGYLKSPFEDRLALILSFKSKGTDGPPDLITCKIAGISLKSH